MVSCNNDAYSDQETTYNGKTWAATTISTEMKSQYKLIKTAWAQTATAIDTYIKKTGVHSETQGDMSCRKE
jgi:hypothetical protein